MAVISAGKGTVSGGVPWMAANAIVAWVTEVDAAEVAHVGTSPPEQHGFYINEPATGARTTWWGTGAGAADVVRVVRCQSVFKDAGVHVRLTYELVYDNNLLSRVFAEATNLRNGWKFGGPLFTSAPTPLGAACTLQPRLDVAEAMLQGMKEARGLAASVVLVC